MFSHAARCGKSAGVSIMSRSAGRVATAVTTRTANTRQARGSAASAIVGGGLIVSLSTAALTASSERMTANVSNRIATSTAQHLTSRLQATNAAIHKPTARLPFQGRAFSSSAPKSDSTNGSSRSLLQWYEGHLHERPVLTKMCTGVCLWSIGDVVAQLVPQWAGQIPKQDYDFVRTGRAAVFGFFIHAPASHLHFNFLEYLTQRAGATGLGIPIFKAVLEQFVYWSWISNGMYHGAMGAMQGMTLRQIYDRIADVIWETQKAQWVFWIPVQLLNFRFVPVRHQLNVVLLTSIVWTALLSAWYPPVEDDQEAGRKHEIAEAASHD